ncbi:MAG: LPS assembly lipoprotein LptE [Gemmatimonadales bacterium]
MRPIPGFLIALSLAASGCLYGFGGGTGFPPNIKTVAVLPFENLTPEPTLTNEINRAVREAVQGRLGLRPAGEAQADAIVTGIIQRYDPDIPIAFGGDPNQNVQVTSRKVQISVNVRIVDQKNDKVLWERQGLSAEGVYTSNEADGRKKAIEKLITDIVEGAQSQW